MWDWEGILLLASPCPLALSCSGIWASCNSFALFVKNVSQEAAASPACVPGLTLDKVSARSGQKVASASIIMFQCSRGDQRSVVERTSPPWRSLPLEVPAGFLMILQQEQLVAVRCPVISVGLLNASNCNLHGFAKGPINMSVQTRSVLGETNTLSRAVIQARQQKLCSLY